MSSTGLPFLLIYLFPLVVFLCPLAFLVLPKGNLWIKILAGLSLAASLLALGWLAFLTDYFLSLYHSVLFCAGFSGLALATSIPVIRHFRFRAGALLPAVFCVVLIAAHFYDSSRERFLLKFYTSVAIGMSKQEVQSVLQQTFAGRGLPPPEYSEGVPPAAASMQYTLTDTPGRYGPWSAIVLVNLADGKVTEKRYENN